MKRGDSPWRIAQRHLGAGERWRELRYADGRALGSEMIHPGQILLVPSTPEPSAPTQAASASVPAADTAAPKTVVVRPGDSLSEIAGRELGDSEQYPGIWTANRGHVMSDGRRFTDPDLIRPGWALAVPGGVAASPAAPAAATAATPPSGVDAVYNEYVRRLEDLDNDQPHSDVEAIYRRCRARQNRAT